MSATTPGREERAPAGELLRQHRVERLLYLEALCLDRRDWDRWLDLYHPEAVIWMPAWISEETLASDPEVELALIHCAGREDLADRVFRIQTGDSAASTPLARSCHVIGNVLVLGEDAGTIEVSAAWTVHQYGEVKGPRVHGGRYEYELLKDPADGARLLIGRKKIVFLNDAVDVPIDLHNV